MGNYWLIIHSAPVVPSVHPTLARREFFAKPSPGPGQNPVRAPRFRVSGTRYKPPPQKKRMQSLLKLELFDQDPERNEVRGSLGRDSPEGGEASTAK